MRLTEKTDDLGSYNIDQDFSPKYANGYDINFGSCTLEDMVEKLGKLEDAEEELGIDLIKLFKALKDGIYFKHNYYGIEHKQVSYITRTALVYRYSSWGDDDDIHFTYYDYKDYGKTWALTKEELTQ